MKHKFLVLALLALILGSFNSCKKDAGSNDYPIDYPILYVVNGSDYKVNVYCDNLLVATAGAHYNSGAVKLSNTSINLPVYVEAEFYDSNNNYIGCYKWNDYYFRWNKLYKMTLTNSGGTITQINKKI